LSANGLRAYLDALESVHGFIPDMIILDYVGIMKTDEKNPRTSLGRMFEEFRAICVERNAAGVTAHQVSKMGADAQLVKATHVAEDWSLIMTADQAITYSQTPEEEKVGLARLFVAKARTEEDKFGVVITQSYKLGQFALSSAPLDKTYEDYLEEVSPKRWNDDDDSDVEGD
jgi:replicative DNA helicase